VASTKEERIGSNAVIMGATKIIGATKNWIKRSDNGGDVGGDEDNRGDEELDQT